MITPTININGTSRDDLIQPRLRAYDHLHAAVEQLRQVAPNGRDYPGTDRCLADREIHYKRLGDLMDLASTLMLEAAAIKAA